MTWYPTGGVKGTSITIGAEASDVINVAIQLQGEGSSDLDGVGYVWAFLSDNANGLDVSSTAPSGGVAAGTDGDIVVEAADNLVFLLQSEADGDIDIDITETGADTWYLVVVLPDGSHIVSSAITFAA